MWKPQCRLRSATMQLNPKTPQWLMDLRILSGLWTGNSKVMGASDLSGLCEMAADSVLAYKVVRDSSRFIAASEFFYLDLSWFLRGGGGGTFGIVISAIFKIIRVLRQLRATLYLDICPTVLRLF